MSYPILKRRLLVLLAVCLVVLSPIYGQESYSDSLVQVYTSKNYLPQQEFGLLRAITSNHNDPQQRLRFSQIFIERIEATDSIKYLYEAYLNLGGAYEEKGDFPDALDAFLKASNIAQELDSTTWLALSDITIADVYSGMKNHANAQRYYNKAISQLREKISAVEDGKNRAILNSYLGIALLNAGDDHLENSQLDKAMSLFLESRTLFNELNDPEGLYFALGNIGMIYAKQGKPALAEANMNEAIAILEEIESYNAIPTFLAELAAIYLEKNDFEQALKYAQQSLEISNKYDLKEQISAAHQSLSEIYEHFEQPTASLFHFKEHIRFRDSVNNISNTQRTDDLIKEFELAQQEIEHDLENQKERSRSIAFAIVLLFVSILAFVLFRRNQQKNKTQKILNEERRKSDDLLRNILPEETALELRNNGFVKAKKFQSATILFTDFKGFTKYSEELPPEELVKTLDLYFTEFDHIVDKYNIEKIKTLGDSYMCASGLPLPDEEHAKNMILAAQDMLQHVEELKLKQGLDQAQFEIKIGINSGPVVAGVVGERKFAYDIWGDAVNVAARLESSCEPGKINVSESTYHLVKDTFDFESRGEIAIKNRASVNMYYLKTNK